MRSIWAEIDSMEQQAKQAKAKVKSKAALSSSVKQYHRAETTSASSVLIPKRTADNISDSQVPIQNTENNPQTIYSDIQMSNEPS